MDTTPMQPRETPPDALTSLLEARSTDALELLPDARPEHAPALLAYLRDARSTRVARVARALFLRHPSATGAALLTALQPGDDAILDASLAYLHKFHSDALQALCGALLRLRRPDAEHLALTLLSLHAKTPADDLAALDLLAHVGTRRALVTLSGMRDVAPLDDHGVHARLDAVVQTLSLRLGALVEPGALTTAADTTGGHISLATHTGHELSLAEHASTTPPQTPKAPSDHEYAWLEAAPPEHTPPMRSWRARALLLLTQAFFPYELRVPVACMAHLLMPFYVIVFTALVWSVRRTDDAMAYVAVLVGALYVLSVAWWASWWAVDTWRARSHRLSDRLRRGRLVNALVDQAHTPRLLRGSGRGRPMTRIRYLAGGQVQERWLTCHYSTANTERVRAWLDGDAIVVFGVHTPVVLSETGRWTVDRRTRNVVAASVCTSSIGLASLWWVLG